MAGTRCGLLKGSGADNPRRWLTFTSLSARISVTDTSSNNSPDAPRARDFIRELVADDAASGRFGRAPATRFPPEPNGFLHMGHAKSICLNFGIAKEFGGTCNLRFDDTNPFTEDMKYVEAIKRDVQWLGFHWDGEFYASDYFEKLYEIAEDLVRKGKAYVDDQTEEQIARTAAR